MAQLPKFQDENLMVGFDTSDDACVYRVAPDLAMIQTVDFFPPVVDDPFTFGQIAAANALSDIYAMGGEPTLAMNLLCFPSCLSLQVVQQILAGGYDKVREAGAIVSGGHTIEDPEPKYGLCVSGFARPDAILVNSAAKPGDALVLTKPLGVGILSTAYKADLIEGEMVEKLILNMTTLNKSGRDIMVKYHPHSCTDVTGFGLLGHGYEMAKGSGVTIRLFASQLPVLPGAQENAQMGIIPAGAYRNREYLEQEITIDPTVEEWVVDVACDPQTSGGLLISLPREEANAMVAEMKGKTLCAQIVGEVLPKSEKALELVP